MWKEELLDSGATQRQVSCSSVTNNMGTARVVCVVRLFSILVFGSRSSAALGTGSKILHRLEVVRNHHLEDRSNADGQAASLDENRFAALRLTASPLARTGVRALHSLQLLQ
jgi:hypothetical protein